MLVILGGFLGSGRKILAKRIAAKQKLHLYDTESKKTHRHILQRNGSVKEIVENPRNKEQQTYFFRRIIEDFPRLSKMYPDTIIEDAFHRTVSRDNFISEAKKYFSAVVFVWIDSDEAHVENRARHMVRKGYARSFEEIKERRMKSAEQFDGLEPKTRVFKCVLGDDAEVDALWALIQKSAGK